MPYTIDRYLSTLLAYTPAKFSEDRDAGDFACLIQVPASGTESVYSLSLKGEHALFTCAAFAQSVSDCLKGGQFSQPSVDVFQTRIPGEHPGMEHLTESSFKSCNDFSDGCEGLDYYLLIYQFGSEMKTVECWEPYGRADASWKQIVGAFQVLGNQFSKISKRASTKAFECCDSAL